MRTMTRKTAEETVGRLGHQDWQVFDVASVDVAHVR